MIKSIHIKNYKCFKDFDMEGLGPFNVLVGPNDSGKTAFLEAILLSTADWPRDPLNFADLPKMLGHETGPDLVWRNDPKAAVRMELGGAQEDQSPFWEPRLTVESAGGKRLAREARCAPDSTDRRVGGEGLFNELLGRIGKAKYYRLDSKALRKVSALRAKMSETGEGFSSFLDDIFRAEDGSWECLKDHFHQRFPFYRNLRIDKAPLRGQEYGFVLRFMTVHDTELSAQALSDGAMLSLGFIALAHNPNPPGILLVEEPENGVHFASLKDIVGTLRHLSQDKGVQVFATTHSPYLLDLAELNEVWLFNKDEEGAVHAKNLAKVREAQDLKDLFMTGEIWTGLEEKKVAAESRGEK